MRAPGTAACLVTGGLLLTLLHPRGLRAQSGPPPALEQVPASAPAIVENRSNPPTQCIVTLRNGTALRVEVVEDDARADYVLIKYPTGGTTRVPRGVIRSIQLLPATDAHTPQAMESRLVVPPLTAGALQLALISNKPGLSIERIKSEHTSFHFYNSSFTTSTESEHLCSTPCATWVSREERESRFRVIGEGIPTAGFTLPPKAAAVTVSIVAGNSAARVAGFVIIGAGAIVTIFGTTQIVSGNLPDEQRFGLGIPSVVAGLAVLGGGIALAVKYHTRVQVLASKPLPGSP